MKDNTPSYPDVKLTAESPCAELRPFVKDFLTIESTVGYSHLVLPDTGLIAAFRFKGDWLRQADVSLPRAMLSGVHDSARILKRPANTSVILVRFTETGVPAFLHEPVDRLFGSIVALDHIFHRSELGLVEEQLAAAKLNRTRVLVLQRFLLQQLRDEFSPDPLISALVAGIKRAKGRVRVGELVRHSGLSQSALERRFRKILGASPKKFASIVRLRHVVHGQGGADSLTELAYRAGYSDQSHFINDFKRFTGQAPRSFFLKRPFC